MRGWEIKTLGALFEIGSSKRVLKSQWQTEGVPFYRGREITRLATDGFVKNELFISEEHFKELSRKYGAPSAQDIVITAIGTIGNAYIVQSGDNFYFKDASVLWMKRRSSASSEFIHYWLKSSHFFDQLDRGNGATVDTLTIQKLQSLNIQLPPLDEQLQIVAILDEAFAGLAVMRQHAEANLKNARAIFDSRLNAIFSQRGDGWVETTLERAGKLQTGTTPKTSDEGMKGTFIPFIKPGDFRRDGSLNYNNEGLSQIGLSNCRSVPAGSALMVCIGTIGKAAYTTREIATNQQINSFTPHRFIDGKFVFYQMLTERFQRLVNIASSQLTLPIINKSKWALLQIYLPNSYERQVLIARELDALLAETTRLESLYRKKLAAIDELKQSILYKAFSGALSAKDALAA